MAKLITPSGIVEEVTPKKLPFFSLAELQAFVGGYIEIVGTKDGKFLVCNEEGKVQESPLPYNKKATELYGNPNDHIVGNALICNADELD